MLSSITVSNYRGFPRFRLDGLRRINLLVGENSTGKTSILEAAKILAYGTSPFSLAEIMARRGERLPPLDGEQGSADFDVSHFFNGHTAAIGSQFRVRGRRLEEFGVDVSIIEADPLLLLNSEAANPSELSSGERLLGPARALRMVGFNNDTAMTAPLSQAGGLSTKEVRRAGGTGTNLYPIPELSVPMEGLTMTSLAALWNRLLLRSEEKEVINALRIIEPALKDLQYIPGERTNLLPGLVNTGFFVGMAGVASRIPLGSLGDGMKRLLTLALASGHARGGYLLVDEIDTGLHYATLPKMWQLVIEAAIRFNVQVIATTHNGDCVRSLAMLHEDAPELAEAVALHRIEKGFVESVPFSAQELAVGMQHEMEFR